MIAIVREQQAVANPKSSIPFAQGDLVGMIGDANQMQTAAQVIEPDLPTNEQKGVGFEPHTSSAVGEP